MYNKLYTWSKLIWKGKSSLATLIIRLVLLNTAEGIMIFMGEDIKDYPIFKRAQMGLTFAW